MFSVFEPETGDLTIVTDEMIYPNGLAFSPDETVLYVADTSSAFDAQKDSRHFMAFDVVDGRRLQNGRGFAVIEPGLADGFRVDVMEMSSPVRPIPVRSMRRWGAAWKDPRSGKVAI